MARVAPRIPELSEILCSKCGYVLDGLPGSGRCPECGKPVAESTGAERTPPLWESAVEGRKIQGFMQTSLELIIAPHRFYRTFTARGPLAAAKAFASWHWWMASILFAIAAATHLTSGAASMVSVSAAIPGGIWGVFGATILLLTLVTFFCLDGITRIASKLTNWEGSYRGYRLPYQIVLRGMYYHAAHYLPVALLAVVTTVGYQLLFSANLLPDNAPIYYLYILSAQVVISAIYLFQTYWIGMRNMMYANR